MIDQKPLIVALDFDCAAPALALAEQMDPALTRVKVGKQLFTREGPSVVRSLHERGFEVFLDLKFHDIPNTVAGAVVAAAELGVWMVNVHVSGGHRMLAAAYNALSRFESPPLLIGVTVLTSLDDSDLAQLGWPDSVAQTVESLATLASTSGLSGVVCSAQEASRLRALFGDTLLRITPGIRLAGDAAADQRRVLTPRAAIEQGATHLVIGRAITQATSPMNALALAHREIKDLNDGV